MIVIDMELTSKHLRDLRIAHKIKNADLARKMEVTTSAVTRWERAEVIPKIDILFNLAKLYDCTIEDLIIVKEI